LPLPARRRAACPSPNRVLGRAEVARSGSRFSSTPRTTVLLADRLDLGPDELDDPGWTVAKVIQCPGTGWWRSARRGPRRERVSVYQTAPHQLAALPEVVHGNREKTVGRSGGWANSTPAMSSRSSPVPTA